MIECCSSSQGLLITANVCIASVQPIASAVQCNLNLRPTLLNVCSDFLDTAQPMVQLFDPASNTFWRNVKERAVAPVTAFGRNPVRWDTWQPQHVPAVSQWYYICPCAILMLSLCLCCAVLQQCACHACKQKDLGLLADRLLKLSFFAVFMWLLVLTPAALTACKLLMLPKF